MHIPDAFLNPATEAAGFAAMVPIWMLAAKKTRKTLTSRQVPMLSACAAFCFAIQMFNIPALGGTSAHPLGTVLVAILLGPWAAVLAMSLTLAVQALAFGDGGVLSYGINSWNMAFMAAFVGYATYKLVSSVFGKSEKAQIASTAIAALVGTVAASASAGLILGAQPMIAHDTFGQAIYFPFGWSVSMPAMVNTHLLVAGPIEAIVTTLAVAFFRRNFPEVSRMTLQPKGLTRPVWLIVGMVALCPVGLLSTGAAWGEWDVSEIQKLVGYVPKGLASTSPIAHPMLLDYGFSGLTSTPFLVIGYLVSAVVGTGFVSLAIRAVVGKGGTPVVTRQRQESTSLPGWISMPNPKAAISQGHTTSMLDRTASRIQTQFEKFRLSEEIANVPGFLQNISFRLKLVFLFALLGVVASAHSLGLLATVLVLVVVLSWISNAKPMSIFVRALGLSLFFGGLVVLPLLLSKGLSAGLAPSLVIFLRLMAGVFVTLTWLTTTRWQDLLAGLRKLRFPEPVVASVGLCHRYLFVIVSAFVEMLSARRSRQAGVETRRQAWAYAGSASGVLFVKSMAHMEESYMAMVSRSAGKFGVDPLPRDGSKLRLFAGVVMSIFLIALAGGVLHGF